MIEVKAPKVAEVSGNVRLTADIAIDGDVRSLGFEVEERFGQYLCWERSDAFVLAILHYAMMNGQDIVCEAPMTDRLCENLTEQFIPAFCKLNGLRFKLTASVAPEIEHPADGSAIGTGCSCGVDSLHAFAAHPEITHGCLWHGHGGVPGASSAMQEKTWGFMRQRAVDFCADAGKELVVGDSNFDGGCIPGVQWEGMTTNGNLFHAFAMQKMWSKYYIASNGIVDKYSMKMRPGGGPTAYEYFLFPFLSMNRMQVRMDGVDRNRIEKLSDIVSYRSAAKYLNVCHSMTDDGSNCGHGCSKCMITMLELKALGADKAFSTVFDFDYFDHHLAEYVAEYWRGLLQKREFVLEMKPYFGQMRMPLAVRLRAAAIVASKGIKKILRGGTTRVGTFSSKG